MGAQQSHSGSDKSYRTAPTEYSSASSKRPTRIHHNTCEGVSENVPRYFDDRIPQQSPRTSVESYTSSIASDELPAEDELPDYHVPEYSAQRYGPAAIAATPADFSQLFPSHRRLAIRHDDSTLDGNMNLRVDTDVNLHGRRRDMTLFHLRMHDLRDREFSLRRYCRDSGREVCHSSRKVHKSPIEKRPGFQRSLSNALSSMRTRSEQKTPTLASLKRNDSGYASLNSSVDFDGNPRPHSASATPKAQQQHVDPNTMHLEFSNYAHLDMKRAGGKGSKRYGFEYWGSHYSWRRTVRKGGETKAVSYQLTKAGQDGPVAHIIPAPLTPAQMEEEHRLGGWVPPCSMWIADEAIARGQKDVADVVLATGLLALVDDSIKTHFHSRTSKQLLIPRLQMGVEYVGPKRLINEMFKRDTSGSHSRQMSSSSRPSSSAGATAPRAVN
ncbi:uncharacterized protein MYCFIDRAFT_190080 [Pseudocercospora fijiensis CIRAD86]|uniref:Uncharacterized protein n=1 Tax=Pseudocercospora fijiensis (strain CIRAD86) TaxID=383855 RepID=M2YMN4_PSEFD|nr:uncharacterized protein MYCFIDRAFT_190080 [Pseudocercospora fijiensis CIRAD86]EME79010.1 hypothetical protein MYCFIDRAFT_190080 [Pseudocercospora fijiensis CIRAD86]